MRTRKNIYNSPFTFKRKENIKTTKNGNTWYCAIILCVVPQDKILNKLYMNNFILLFNY